MTITNWEGAPDKPREYAGFVYLVTNTQNGKKYIGKKLFWHSRKRKNGDIATVESDWRTYKSSSRHLKSDIEKYGEGAFSFVVLELLKTKKEVSKREVDLLTENKVLSARLASGDYAFYNRAINNTKYRPKRRGSKAYRRKCERISKAIKSLSQNPDWIHPMKGKTHPNKGKKLPQTRSKTDLTGWPFYTDGVVTIRIRPDAEPPSGFRRGMTKRKPRAMTKAEAAYAKEPSLCPICGVAKVFSKRKASYCSKRCANVGLSGREGLGKSDNPQWGGWVKTPNGIFITLNDAAASHGTSAPTISNRCRAGKSGYYGPIKTEDKQIPEEWLHG